MGNLEFKNSLPGTVEEKIGEHEEKSIGINKSGMHIEISSLWKPLK